jgi:torulene dioxygenase
MFFHSVNCYDFIDPLTNVETIHVDLDAYDGKEENIVIYREYSLANVLDPLSPFMNGHLVRYELADISSPKAVASIETNTPAASYPRATVAQAIHDCFMELPRINKAVSCLPGYRYVYGCGGTGQPSPGTQVPIGRLGNGLKVVQCAFFSTIVKTDWLSGTSVKWAPPNGDSCPCEPVFIARPGATEEDDGVVLTIVCNRVGSTSLLVALDAKDLTEVARAEMPHVYGIGPHGTFVSGKEMFSDS